MTGRRPVRVFVDGPPTPAWQARALAHLQSSAHLEVVSVSLVEPARPSPASRLRTRIERHVFGIGADPFAPGHLTASGEHPIDGSLEVWLSEAPAPRDGELVWLRHGGAEGTLEQGMTRALVAGEPWIESEVLLRRAGETVVVARTVSAVRPFSETSSRTLALWKLAAMLARSVERLPGLAVPASPSRRLPEPPSEPAMLWRAARSCVRALGSRLLYRRPWSIRVRTRGTSASGGWRQAPEDLVRWGNGRMYADPFLFEHEGRHHLFCEEVPHDGKLGVISHTELSHDGTPGEPPRRVLEAAHHLSYPFVFEHRGEVFMVPETSAARTVELYRAIDFPARWQRETILLEGVNAADATIVLHDGRLWLFAALAAEGASSLEELCVFWAEDLRGPWHPHAQNPVVSDVRCARPAGAIQRREGRLVRPSQDCSRRYGWAVSFREIDLLSPTAYAEHEIERIEPADVLDARATHTYTGDGRFEAIDLRTRRLRRLRGS